MKLLSKDILAYVFQVIAVILLFAFAVFPSEENPVPLVSATDTVSVVHRLPVFTVKSQVVFVIPGLYQPAAINVSSLLKKNQAP